jgi:hypothetical protein
LFVIPDRRSLIRDPFRTLVVTAWVPGSRCRAPRNDEGKEIRGGAFSSRFWEETSWPAPYPANRRSSAGYWTASVAARAI